MGKLCSIVLCLGSFSTPLVKAVAATDIEAWLRSLPVVEITDTESDSGSSSSPRVKINPVAMPGPSVFATVVPLPVATCRVCPAALGKLADYYLSDRYTIGQLHYLFHDKRGDFKPFKDCHNCDPSPVTRRIKHRAAERIIENFFKKNNFTPAIAPDSASATEPTIAGVLAWAGPYLAEKQKRALALRGATRPAIIRMRKRKVAIVLGTNDAADSSGIRKVVARTAS